MLLLLLSVGGRKGILYSVTRHGRPVFFLSSIHAGGVGMRCTICTLRSVFDTGRFVPCIIVYPVLCVVCAVFAACVRRACVRVFVRCLSVWFMMLTRKFESLVARNERFWCAAKVGAAVLVNNQPTGAKIRYSYRCVGG